MFMSDMLKRRRFLILVDASYVQYFMIFGSVAEFQKKCPDEARLWIKPADECDQSALPNLLNCQEYRRVLSAYV